MNIETIVILLLEQMDSSQYLRSKLRNQQIYKSNWQPRDASEVTNRHNQMAQANNATTHHGPLPECCTGNVLRVPLPNPGRGFSSDYSASTVFQRKAGCAQCHDENFGQPGGVVVKDCCQGITIEPAIYGAYVTNVEFLSHSAVDSQGNTWIFVWSDNINLPIQVYNRYGVLVESLSPRLPYDFGAIIFISADGVSNIWVNQFTVSSASNLSRDNSTAIFDSQGNFICPLTIFGSSVPTYFQIYDRNSQSYFTYSAAAGDFSYETLLLKISPTGVWSGSSDPNTWVGRLISSRLGISDINFPYYVKLDNNDNIIINSVISNSSGSSITVRSYDKSGTAFGTAIPIVSGSNTVYHSILVKFASDGGSTGSWNAYIYNTTVGYGFSIYEDNLQITSNNKIVFAFQYTATGNELRGSDNTIIGAVLPFSSSIGLPVYHTCIAVFGEDGTAANSFRVTIQPTTGAKQVTPIAVLVDSANSIYCVGTAQQGNNTEVIRPYNASDVAVVGVDFTGNYGNVFFVKFTSTGVPSWISSLRGQNTPFTIFGVADNTYERNQYINAYLDNQQNLVAQIIYISGTATYYNTTQTLVRTLAVPVSGYESCLIKISPDGLTAYSARIGTVTGGSPASTYLFRLYFDSSNNINVLGFYQDNPCGFYSSTDDTTPLVQVQTGGAANTNNQFLAIYSPTFSSVQVARVCPTIANRQAIPFELVQRGTNYIVLGQYTGPAVVFNFGNYTTTPDKTLVFQGAIDTVLINFSSASSSNLWTVTISSTANDYLGLLNNNFYFFKSSFLRVLSDGTILFPIGCSAMPNIYDRGGTLVSSILNNQTASPPSFAISLSIPANGYSVPPATPTETVQTRSVSCYCADPGITRQPFPVDCSRVAPSYTGSANQVPILSNQQFGHIPKQQYPYPSG